MKSTNCMVMSLLLLALGTFVCAAEPEGKAVEHPLGALLEKTHEAIVDAEHSVKDAAEKVEEKVEEAIEGKDEKELPKPVNEEAQVPESAAEEAEEELEEEAEEAEEVEEAEEAMEEAEEDVHCMLHMGEACHEKCLHDCMRAFLFHLNQHIMKNDGEISASMLGPMMESGLKIVEVDGRPAIVLHTLCPYICPFGKELPTEAPVDWEQVAMSMLPEWCIGAMTAPVPEIIRTHFGFPAHKGLWVEYVVPNSPAHVAGIHRGDLILEACVVTTLDGKETHHHIPLDSHETLSQIIQDFSKDVIQLRLLCGGVENHISLTPVSREELLKNASAKPEELETPEEVEKPAEVEAPVAAPEVKPEVKAEIKPEAQHAPESK